MILVFLSLISFFFLFLVLKQLLKLRFCVLCLSVFSSWALFLTLFWLNRFDSLTLVAVLVGSSLTGFYFLVERKVKPEWLVFRLPFFLSLVFIGFLILGQFSQWLWILGLLLALWLIFGIAYLFRTKESFRTLVRQLIDCCKNW